jgi:hypothetical protein
MFRRSLARLTVWFLYTTTIAKRSSIIFVDHNFVSSPLSRCIVKVNINIVHFILGQIEITCLLNYDKVGYETVHLPGTLDNGSIEQCIENMTRNVHS